MIKNITSIECLGVFLQMRAFAEIEARLAAAQVVFHQRRTAYAAAALARIQGEISPTEVAWPMCRPQICERRKWPLPPPWPDWRFDSRHREIVSLDASLQRDLFGLSGRVRRVRETSLAGLLKPVKPASGLAGQMPDPPHADIVADHGLFASLILRRVRAQGSPVNRKQPECFSDDRKLGLISGVASEVMPALVSRAGRSTAPATTDLPDSPKAPLETQLAELAWRRVHRLTVGGRA